MKASELENILLEAGCSPNNFCIGSSGTASDVYCLSEKDGIWQVYYTERGRDSDPLFESRNEAKACQFYFDKIMRIEHWHLVGFFEDDKSAIKMQDELKASGIKPIRNDMPPLQAGDPNLRRVFVVGKDIFKVKEIYPSLPVKNA